MNQTSLRRIGTLAAVILTFVPILLIFLYVVRYSPDFIWSDEWVNRAPVAVRTADGTLEAGDLFAPFGGMQHRIFFAQVSTVVSTRLFGWSLLAENIGTFGYAVLTFAALAVVISQAFGPEHRAQRLILLVVSSWLIFSVQAEISWLGVIFGLRFHTMVFFFAGLITLTRPRLTDVHIAIAALCAGLSMFTVSSGLIVWAVYFFVILFHPERKWRYLVALVIAGAVSWLVYTRIAPSGRPMRGFDLSTFVALIPILIGRAFAPVSMAALLIGIIGLLLFAGGSLFILRRGNKQALILPVALALFAVLSEMLTAFGRSEDGIEIGFRAWYVPQSNVFWIGLVMLGISVLDTARWLGRPARTALTVVTAATAIILGVLYLVGMLIAYRVSDVQRIHFDGYTHCAQIYPFFPDNPCAPAMHDGGTNVDTHTLMRQFITLNLLSYARHNLYPIPAAYAEGSPLWVDVPDAEQATLIAYAVLAGLPLDRKIIDAGSVRALAETALAQTGQFWTLRPEGAPAQNPFAGIDRPSSIIYEARILPDVPFILTGYQLD